ncbi:MAG: leucine-rich repeat protein [Clostridia bacterium]|nr:leucine-rich repeat protein [Clostridia bacterium]
MKSKKLLMALLMVLIVAMGLFAVACEPEEIPPLTEGPETGTYFYDADDGEYLLILNSGERFTFMVAGENKSGTYALDEAGVLTLTFNYEVDGSITAQYVNDTVRLTYNNKAMEFKRKVEYTVTFNSMGGSSISEVAVFNGRAIQKPADPTKEGYVFAGWYKEQSCATPFVFGSEKVTSNVTLYAKWIAIEVGVLNYTVDFDLGYSEADKIQSVQTLNGKLYDIATPARSGYVFGGWWISDSEQRDKLTAKYTAETVFTQDTTLFAVWNESATAIMPSVTNSGIAWDGISGITSYSVQITNEAGEVVKSESNHGSTIFNVDWASLPAGEYCVSVQSSNGNYSAVRYYTNKALDRVSLFSVVGSVLTYNAVDNAETYYITVECGNEGHVHTLLNNGKSTSFDFANCPMVEGGIKFVVVAEADGFAASTSRTFVVNRELNAIEAIVVNEVTEVITWDPVEFATGYVVAISVDGVAQGIENIGNKTSYCYKKLAGDIEINVYPVAEGYNSPVYTSVEIAKETLATPTNIIVNGTVVTWDAVEDATGYSLIINGTSINVVGNSYDLTAELATMVEGEDFTISVIARGDKNSLASDVVTARKEGMYGTLKYQGNVVSWRAVAGATRYEVRVNNMVVADDIVGANSCEVELTKAGYNTISVCYYNQYDEASVAATIEVYAYTIYLNPENGEEGAVRYYAIGDKIDLPTYTLNGYTFDGWYNVRGGASVNGAEYTDEVFVDTANINLYANWKANKYTVTFVYGDGEVDAAAPVNAEVVFGKDYDLPAPAHVDPTMAFIAWTPEKDVLSARVTAADGESIKPWSIYETTEDEDIKLYPVWTKAFSFALENGTYAISKDASGIHKATALTIPTKYKDIDVTIIADFSACSNLAELNIPDTIQIINGAAFDGCSRLSTINVYDNPNGVPGPYSSIDGVLVINREGVKEVAFVSEYNTGKFVIPDGITTITNVFAGTRISEVVIPASVTAIRNGAFEGCTSLRTVTFEDGTAPITIDAAAFKGCTALTSITLPARFTLSGGVALYRVFEGCNNLLRVTVSSAHTEYKSVDGVVLNKGGDTLMYYPTGRTGAYTIPAGVYNIGDYAFCRNDSLTSIVIPDSVVSIGKYAFEQCAALTTVKVGAGVRTIGERAFYRCKALKTVDFSTNNVLTDISDFAFAYAEEISTYGSENYTLTGVVLPQSVETIGDGAFFSQAAAIVNLNIPNCTTIGRRAFFWNYSIETADLRSVVTLSDGAFRECRALYSVTFRDLNFSLTQEEKENITYNVPFTGCNNIVEIINLGTANYGSAGIGSVWYVRGANDPSRFFTTEDGKFLYYTDGSVTRLFKYLGNDSEVVLPETLGGAESYSIYNGAFANNVNISKVTIPAAVTSIGNGSSGESGFTSYPAFYGCAGLAEVYNLSSLNITAGSTDNGYVANYAVVVYASATEESPFVEQNGFFFTVTRDSEDAITSVALSTFVATSTTVVLPDYFVEGDQNYNYTITKNSFGGKTIENLTIGAGVTDIPASLFASDANLKSLTINGNGETVIGNQAFYRCTSLETVNLTGVKKIGDNAFSAYTYGSYSSNSYTQYAVPVKELVFDEHLEIIGYNAFFGCTSLESVQLGENVSEIWGYAFAFTALKEAVIPATVMNNPEWAATSGGTTNRRGIGIYAGIANLESIIIEEGVTKLPNYLFCGTYSAPCNVESVTLPSTLESIGNGVFQYFVRLSTITIPESVTSIGSSAFNACYKLKVIVNNSDLEIVEGATSNGAIAQYAMVVLGKGVEVSLSTEVDEEGFEFTTLNGKAFLTGYYGDNAAIITPYDYKGGTYEIAPYAFLDDYRFVSVTLGKGVTAVGAKAFYPQTKSSDGSGIASIDLNEGLISIGDNAFYNAAIAEIVIPSTVETIGASAFAQNKLMTKATILSGAVGSSAFSGCLSLGVVIIGEGVTSIGSSAFGSCSKLYEVYDLSEHIEVVKGATSNGGVAQYAEAVYDSLDAESMFIEIEGFKFAYDEEGVLVLSAYVGSTTNLVLPVFTDEEGNVVNYKIKDSFMNGNTAITSVTIPDDTAFEVGNRAFYNCKNLTTIVIGNSVKTLAQGAFEGYSRGASYNKVTSITLGSSIETIGANAFKNLDQVSGALIIPDSVKTIGDSAFYYGTGYTSIVLGASVESVGYQAFRNCTNVTQVTFKGPIASLDSSAFQGMTNFTKKVDLTTESFAVWASTDFSSQSTNMISETGELYVNGTKITEITIPAGVTHIGDYAFAGLEGITKLTIGADVTSIGTGAFNGLDLTEVHVASLDQWLNIEFESSSSNPLSSGAKLYVGGTQVTTVTVPATVTEIKAYAFYGVTALTEVTIGEGVTSIGRDAFYGCTALTKVNAASVEKWLGIEFANASANPLNSGAKLYVGATQVTSVIVPNGITEIKAYAFYGATGITAVTINGAVVFGTDAFNFEYELTINVTDLAAWAATDFASAASNPISEADHFVVNGTEVTVLELNVSRIGNYAFAGFAGLTKVTLGANVTAIGVGAFDGCDALAEIHVSSVDAWLAINFEAASANPLRSGAKLYVGGEEVTALNINVEAVKANAFNGATSITEVTFGENVKTIGADAFVGCNAIAKVNVASIEAWLGIEFANANANPLIIAHKLYVGGEEVTALNINVEAIKANAFNGATSITEVTLGANVKTIGENAFAGCTAIAKVNAASIEAWLGIEFANASANPLSVAHKLYVGGEEVTAVVVPDAVTAIKAYAFNGASSLTYVVMPKTVTSIGSSAFANCGSLDTVYYMGTLVEWNAISGDKDVFAYVWNYSETETTEKGNFWRYVEGVPTPWADWVTLFEISSTWIATWTFEGWDADYVHMERWTMVITKTAITVSVLTSLDDWGEQWPDASAAVTYTATDIKEDGTGGYTFKLGAYGDCHLYQQSRWGRVTNYFEYGDGNVVNPSKQR